MSSISATERMVHRTLLLLCPTHRIRRLVSRALADQRFELVHARDQTHAWKLFQDLRPAVVVAAAESSQADDWALLRRIRRRAKTPFLVFSTQSDVPTAVSAIKAGVDDFFVLGTDPLSDQVFLQKVLAKHLPSQETAHHLIVGRSRAMRRVREKIEGIAGLSIPLTVQGESGTGRSHLVRALLSRSKNCSGVSVVPASRPRSPKSTDARKIVCLDAIDRLSPLEQHLWGEEIARCLANDRNAPTMIIATNSVDISVLVESGKVDAAFAERLTAFSIYLPPLRSRTADIAPLALRFALDASKELRRPEVVITPASLKILSRHAWPGNVRELRSVVRQLVVYAKYGRVTGLGTANVLAERPSRAAALRISRERRQRDELERLLSETSGNYAEIGRRIGMSRGAVIYRAQKFGLR